MDKDRKQKADLPRKISFDDAWRNFLVIRHVSYKMKLILHLGPNGSVVSFDCGPFLKKEIDGKQYFCDESASSDIPLAFPEDVVLAEINRRLTEPLRRKRLAKQDVEIMKRKGETLVRKMEARLGSSTRSETQRLISEKQYWEALFSLHQILEHRLRTMLMYKSMKIDVLNRRIELDATKEHICTSEFRTFKHLTNTAFLVGAIDGAIRGKILSFDADRDTIVHKLLRSEVPSFMLEKLCVQGLQIMDALEKSLSVVVPKPKLITMRRFNMPELIHTDEEKNALNEKKE